MQARRALRAAFPHTIPILTGFLFLGTAYGIYMNVSGFPFWVPMLTSAFVYGGSLEFVIVGMLLSPFAPLQTFLMALMIQARHLFYGVAMLDRFRGTGWKKPYLIFSLCDETFSVSYAAEPPLGVDRGWFMFFIALLNQFYWVFAATLGGLLGMRAFRHKTLHKRFSWGVPAMLVFQATLLACLLIHYA